MPLPSSMPTAFFPLFKLAVMSRVSYRQVLLYFVQPGDKKSLPIFSPLCVISYSPRPQTLTSARLRPGLTENPRRNNSDGMFVSDAPIHCACQSELCSTPIVQF